VAWVYAAALLLLGLCGLAWLARLRYSLEIRSPRHVQGSVAFSFLWFRKEFRFDPDEEEPDEGKTGAGRDGPPGPAWEKAPGGQAGFLRVPDGLRARLGRTRERLRRAAWKWLLDPQVWRALARFGLRILGRVLRMLHPSLEFLRVASRNIPALGRFAGLWSGLGGMYPALAGEVEYGFDRPFAVHLRLSGGCTGLGLAALGAQVLLWFPWLALARRFVGSWRNPRLKRWQRRLAAAVS
jgi:hypothetical protein